MTAQYPAGMPGAPSPPPGYVQYPRSPHWQYVPPGNQRAAASGRSVLVWFGLVLLAAVVVGGLIVWLLQPGPVQPECPDPSEACGVPPVRPEGAPALRVGTTWESEDLDFSFDYDPDWWEVQEEGNRSALLVIPTSEGDVAFLIEGASAADESPEAMLAAMVEQLEDRVLGLEAEDDTDRQLLGEPIVGYRDGVGGLYRGTLDTPQGPSVDVAIAVLAASDGEATIVVTVVSPEDIREGAFQLADSLLNTLRWPAEEE